MMKCFVCSKGIEDNVSLFRQNPKGEIGIWACEGHNKKLDAELLDLVKIIEKANGDTTAKT